MKSLFVLFCLAPLLAYAKPIISNNVTVGDGNPATNKTVTFNIGSGTTNPKFKWNASTHRIEFSNDGSTFSPVGGGGGGGSTGIEMLTNPGWEQGTATYVATGGTYTTTTTAANVGDGLQSGSWIPGGGSQTLTSTQFAIPAGLYGRNCEVAMIYQKAANNANHTLQVIDGSSNILASVSLPQATSYQYAYADFICPSSGTLAWQVVSGGTDQIFTDDAHLGETPLIAQVSQASLAGGIQWFDNLNCQWIEMAGDTTSFHTFPAAASCPTPTGSQLQGNAVVPSTHIPGIKFSSLPPGRYHVIMTGIFGIGSNNGFYQIQDGNGNASPPAEYSSAVGMPILSGWFDYTTAQWNVNFQPACKIASAGNSCEIDAQNGTHLDIQVYRFPANSDTVLNLSNTPASWSGYSDIDSFWRDNSTSGFTDFTPTTTATLTERTNRNFGVVTTAGSNLPGITFTPPATGRYLVCAHPDMYMEAGNIGVAQLTDGVTQIAVATTQLAARNSASLCGIYDVSSLVSVTLKLQGRTDAGGSVLQIDSDAGGVPGSHAIEWSVAQLDVPKPAPVIVNSISSNGSGPWRMESATTDVSCNVVQQTGSWISNGSHPATGQCSFPITGFSAVPNCVLTAQNGSNLLRACQIWTNTTTSTLTTRCGTDAGAASDESINIMCMGAR